MSFGVIEGSGYEVLRDDFGECFIGHARLERLWTGGRWLEGPAWFAAGRYLLFSDIPNNRLLRWDETNGVVSAFRAPSDNSNGNTVDTEGRLVSCEHRTRQVTRTEHDGSRTVLADRYDGKRLNSPNDVVVGSDGTVWFTDPSYGILTDYEGIKSDVELPCHVYRRGPDSELEVVADDFLKPNGIALSPDEKSLYVVDTGATHAADGPRHLRRFAISDDGRSLSGGEVFAESTAGLFDGFRFDADGRIWTSAADGVHCLAADGTLIGKIRVPEMVANVTFGGPRRNRLFICGTTSLYSIFLAVNGAARG